MNPNKRRERKLAKRRDRRERRGLEQPAGGTTRRCLLRAEEVRVLKEVEYIIGRAREQDGRVVTLGDLVLFSTETGDAWLLDSGDGFALRLARDGAAQPYHIVETATNFAIAWHASFLIEGDTFVVHDRSGQTRAIAGYPVAEIAQAIRRARGE